MSFETSAGAEDLIAAGWQPIRPSAFSRLVGPIFHRRDGEADRFCFRVEPKHDNTRKRPHGGMIMTFCDEALGLTAHWARPETRMLTIDFACQFIDASAVGDLVEIEPRITRITKSLVFMRGDCTVDGRIVASCNGIWKVVRPPPSGGDGGP